MKQALLPLLLLWSFYSQAREKVPVIKANTPKASISLENGLRKDWRIDPGVQPDVFTTAKITGKESIVFRTDIDSIVLQMKPGDKKDFVVLLGKDTCLTRIQCPELKNFSKLQPEIHDTIPLAINDQNTIYVRSVLNGTDTLQLNFDTGTSDLVLTRNTLQHKVRSSPALYHTAYDLQIGGRLYKSRIYPAELSGHDTDGRFGWDLFDGYVVELNYDHRAMIVHSRLPAYVVADNAFAKLDIRYIDNVFLVKSTITQDKVANEHWFLFDTGYQRTAMLDGDLLREDNFPAEKMNVIKKAIMRGAQGNEIPVVTAALEALTIGSYKLANVPVQQQTVNKPLPGINIHILGNEVLKRFNMFLDFQHNVVYLKPNHYYTDPYIDQGTVRQ
jgi:hypothetical protein